MVKRREISDNDYYILNVLLREPLYGYAIRKEVKWMTEGKKRLSIATLYDTLHRLLREGFIEQQGDEQTEGRVRRIYRITGLGEHALQERNSTIDLLQRIRQLRVVEGEA